VTPFIFIIALIVVSWLLYKLYFKKFWQQGKPGKIKLGLIAVGLIFVGLALTGRAHALMGLIGAAMTQVVRLAPLLIRFAPSLRGVLGTGTLGAGMSANSGNPGVSRVSTNTIDMTLDHSTGAVDGEIKSGEYTGRLLSQLTITELRSLYSECQKNDQEALKLLHTYAMRERASEWQEPNPGRGDSTAAASSAMGIDEARAILAVTEHADKSDIITAHRSLMSRLHPDKGGSNYLAAKVNSAKSVLLEALKS